MRDLYHATRDNLIRIILEQRDAFADRDRQIAALRDDQAAIRQLVTELTTQVRQATAGQNQDASLDTPTRNRRTPVPASARRPEAPDTGRRRPPK